MEQSKYRLNLDDLESVPIQHGSALKKIFVKTGDAGKSLTQIAWSRFEPGDLCDLHHHPTMTEFFFVHKGTGIYEIGNEILLLREGDFLSIPPMTEHRIIADKEEPLELFYFGISV